MSAPPTKLAVQPGPAPAAPYAMNKLRRRQIGIQKARRVLRVMRAYFPRETSFYSDDSLYAKKLLKTRVRCSCPMCGNYRRHFGKVTHQEELAKLEAEFSLWEQLPFEDGDCS